MSMPELEYYYLKGLTSEDEYEKDKAQLEEEIAFDELKYSEEKI